MSEQYLSWGRYPRTPQRARVHPWQEAELDSSATSLLPFGNGRSYGDVCLNSEGLLIDVRALNHFLHFDREQGILRCEAGLRLDQMLALIVPQGWFLPVTPGTQFITLGGAIANDVHGKNHHSAGTFGCHLRCFELLRSDGTRLLCSPTENADWFAATIGGLGLTGLITWAEIQLIPVHNPLINNETVKFSCIEEFFDISQASEHSHVYTVSWVDCMASGRKLGRGLFMRGNHAAPQWDTPYKMNQKGKLSVPLEFPNFALNEYSIKAFNWLYYNKQFRREQRGLVHYLPFFYPLDGVRDWNRIYGKRGFFQYQCVIPNQEPAVIRKLLQRIADSGQGSFLAVMKVFGDKASPGMLSFPRPGFTLALDFANHGQSTLDLFNELDAIVRDNQGSIYPAKDARMSGADFRQFYPAWENFQSFIDPRFSSDFWRRVMAD